MKNLTEKIINESNAAREFEKAAISLPPEMPSFSGKGFIICAGGPYIASAYIVVCLLRHYGATIPIEIWHAGEDEIPAWMRPAFKKHNVTFHDIMLFCPDRPLKQMRGFPIKPAALLHSKLRQIMFIDADCFPVCNLEFLFDSKEFIDNQAIFFPDHRRHFLLEGKAVWNHIGIEYNGDPEFETGLLAFDKKLCWKEINLVEWMNKNSDFWYRHAMGDKDTFYLCWRKLKHPFFLAPPCRRISTVLTRHYWHGDKHLVDHRTGTSKYTIHSKKTGPFTSYLTAYKNRPAYKNLIDEVLQRFVNKNYSLHIDFLEELKTYLPK